MSTRTPGNVDVVRYVAIDDCGPAINPKLIDGQVHGGIVHSIGQALFERVHYDEDGQLVTRNFADYALPSAADLPSFELDRTETPSPVNSLGVKGIGEAGTIAASAAVTNAVIDALRPLGVTHEHAAQPDAGLGDDPGGERVIPAEFDYVAPGSSTRRSTALPAGGEDAKVLAGGHSLLPLMKLRLAAPIAARRPAPGRGAARRVRRRRRDPLRRDDPPPRRRDRHYGLVAAAAATIADQQVRNMGTIGGTLAHGDPASDLPAVMLAAEGW